jgi:trimethylguanosine synthase
MAKHIAQRVIDRVDGNANILDAFCGVGGNAIQFGKKCGYCVACDMDLLKVQYSMDNALVYGL